MQTVNSCPTPQINHFFNIPLARSTQVLDRSASDVREICPERLTAVTIMCCIPLGVAEESL
jgi:hypothetical protein